jgi:hypothetical protein
VHDWASHACLVAGTPVQTATGIKAIENITTGERVWTPCGLAEVTHAGRVRRAEALMNVECSDGSILCATPEHKVLTQNGFVCVDALRYNDRIYRGTEWTIRLSALCSRVANIGFRDAITGDRSGAAMDRATSIAPFGNRITGVFHRITTFITSTAIPSTTLWRIWPVWNDASICLHTHGLWWRAEHSIPPTDTPWPPPPSGIGALRASRGTVSTGKPRGPIARGIRACVVSAVKRFCRRILRVPSGAMRVVKTKPVRLPEAKPWVYDLTVESHACYRANGILVSNSDAFRGLAVRHQMPKEPGRALGAVPTVPNVPGGWMGA